MFNLLGAMGALGRVLPNYVQGERQAIQDNWKDLENYNNVQSGQINNLWSMATFNPKLNMQYDAADNSRMQRDINERNFTLYDYMYPGNVEATKVWAANAGEVARNQLQLQNEQAALLRGMYASMPNWINRLGPFAGSLLGGLGGLGNPYVMNPVLTGTNPSITGM